MQTPTAISRSRKHEAGAALLIAMLLLAMLGVIGLASMETVTRDRQVAGFQNRGRVALYAAEAGVAHATGIIRKNAQVLAPGGEGALESFNPGFPGKGGATAAALGADFPAPGSPSYRMDPAAQDPTDLAAAAQAIRYMGRGELCPGWIMSMTVGSVIWAEALWDIRVAGSAPGGGNLAIQATAASCHPYN
ncbi:MAG TPA: PilX N-terminal domain-containing pilus assembly protein [Myxococcota bacterium]